MTGPTLAQYLILLTYKRFISAEIFLIGYQFFGEIEPTTFSVGHERHREKKTSQVDKDTDFLESTLSSCKLHIVHNVGTLPPSLSWRFSPLPFKTLRFIH